MVSIEDGILCFLLIGRPCVFVINCMRELTSVENTEYQELKSLLNEPSNLSADRLLVLFMEDILDVYVCLFKMRLALPKKVLKLCSD